MLNQDFHGGNRDYAVAIVRSVCCLAGDPEFLAHRRTGRQKSLASIIARHDTPRLFDWLVEALSYQGIADKVAYEYMLRPILFIVQPGANEQVIDGRKREAGTALFDGKGELCGRARALWIEPRSQLTSIRA